MFEHHVRSSFGGGRPSLQEGKQLDILLTTQGNPHVSNGHFAIKNDVSRQMKLVQVVFQEDFDRGLEFCKVMMERCINNPEFIKINFTT